MKGRQSGMPDEDYWTSFFDAEVAVETLFGEQAVQGDLVEFGGGYGTFTLPAARRTTGMVTALDIEPEMVERLQQRAKESKRPSAPPVIFSRGHALFTLFGSVNDGKKTGASVLAKAS